jgi:16S rRNA (guanine(966)-N(2))-methyltransferase RsmD
MALRIVAGELRGRRIESPGDESVRPTADRVREAIFSILGDVSGARVLDLYCGTGALAIEAVSRGAESAVLVDTEPTLASRNVEALDLSDRARVERSDASAFLRGAPPASFDLIFLDPPYGLAPRLAAELDSLLPPPLAEGGRVIAESAAREPLDLSLPVLRERRYGDTLVRIHEREEPGE